jgi:hypothetical protein
MVGRVQRLKLGCGHVVGDLVHDATPVLAGAKDALWRQLKVKRGGLQEI